MQSDDDLQTTLSKWPFILGDVLLVATALAIAILGDWQLSTWQVVSCVISVALGAALFVIPYVIEFQVRVREEAEDRTADVRVLQRHIVNTQQQVEEVVERMESFEAGLSNLAHAQQPDSAVPAQPLEERIDPLSKEQAEQSIQLKALAKQVGSLAKSLDAKADKSSAQVAESPDPDVPAEEKVEEPEKVAPVEVTPDEPKTKKSVPRASPLSLNQACSSVRLSKNRISHPRQSAALLNLSQRSRLQKKFLPTKRRKKYPSQKLKSPPKLTNGKSPPQTEKLK